MSDKEMTPQPGAGPKVAFGYADIELGAKQGMVDEVFTRVARRYDLMNDLMSGGMHRLWKRALVDWLAPPARAGAPYQVLDMAGGTGDVATLIARRSPAATVTVADINAAMLDVGRGRAQRRHLDGRLTFQEANAEELPFAAGSFDAYVIAFGIRNVPRIEAALAEAKRVLKHGGRFMCLEFSTVDVAGLDRLYETFSFQVIPRLGQAVAGDADSYRYLVESIRRFPNQEAFGAMIRDAGLERVTWRNLTGGIAAIHSAWKL